MMFVTISGPSGGLNQVESLHNQILCSIICGTTDTVCKTVENYQHAAEWLPLYNGILKYILFAENHCILIEKSSKCVPKDPIHNTLEYWKNIGINGSDIGVLCSRRYAISSTNGANVFPIDIYVTLLRLIDFCKIFMFDKKRKKL